MANEKKKKRNHYYARKVGSLTPEPREEIGKARYQAKSEPRGTRGLRHASGYIQEAWMKEFRTWDRAVRNFKEMRDYYIIATMLDAVKLPLLKSQIVTEPAPAETPGDVLAAEWLYDTIHHMHRQQWISHIEDMLSAIEFGWALGEIVLEKRNDGRLWLKNIDPRGQDTLERWKFDVENTDEVISMIQRNPNSGEMVDIPLAKCVHVTYRGRKGNPEGNSVLMSLYWTFRQLKDAETYEMMGIEHDVGGMPVAELPPEGNINDNDLATLENGLAGMRRDDSEYLITPAGVKIVPYGSSNKMYDIGAVIDRKKKEILMRLFAQFLMLGMEQVGTQALVQGAQSFFNYALESIQEMILEAWNLQLVPYLFSFNTFLGMTDYPQIKWIAPGKVNISDILTALNTAVGAKMFTPTDVDEDHLREILDWPKLPEDERGMPRDIEAPAMPGIFDIRNRMSKVEKKVGV